MTLSLSSAVLWMTTLTSGLISRIEAAADSALDRPMIALPVDDLTLQVRLVDGVEVDHAERATPAAADTSTPREPRHPGAHTQPRAAFLSRFCPVTPRSGMIRCRE
jgi:hypothetical protein